MASSINASTSGAGGLITTADNTGILQLQSGGTTIATISSTGLQQNVGAPTFSAYQSSVQALTGGVWTKIQLQTEEWDTANCFDNATNYRFTPNVAGYYQINACVEASTNFNTQSMAIYKNGASAKRGVYGQTNFAGTTISAVLYLNGTTDYIELYANLATSQNLTNTANSTYFQAFLARSA